MSQLAWQCSVKLSGVSDRREWEAPPGSQSELLRLAQSVAVLQCLDVDGCWCTFDIFWHFESWHILSYFDILWVCLRPLMCPSTTWNELLWPCTLDPRAIRQSVAQGFLYTFHKTSYDHNTPLQWRAGVTFTPRVNQMNGRDSWAGCTRIRMYQDVSGCL